MGGQVAHDLVSGHRGSYRVAVEDVELYGRRPETPEKLFTLRRAGDAGHIVPLGDEEADGPAPEHPRGTGDEDPHGANLA